MESTRRLQPITLYFVLIALVALGNGFSDSVYANYFNDAYHVTTVQRGFLEFPRELPGVCCAIVLALLGSLGDLRLSLIAQLLACFGLTVLGLTTPSFTVMCVFLFVNSLGMHLFMPLQDSIGMNLAEPNRIGWRMGQYASVRSIVGFVCAVCVFLGFRFELFSFVTPVKVTFIIGAVAFLMAAGVALTLLRRTGAQKQAVRPTKLLFRKRYKYYYALAVLQGVQKQIAYVYGSWVIIRMLGQGADAMSLLYLAANLLGMFFVRLLGRWIDRFGVRRMLFVDALSFIGVYVLYGIAVYALHTGAMAVNAVSIGLVCALFILDRMSMQCGLVKAVYLRSIALDGNDVSHTLSTGTSLDHIVAIIAAPVCGLIWTNAGPHWVFIIAALFSLGNVYIASRVRPELASMGA